MTQTSGKSPQEGVRKRGSRGPWGRVMSHPPSLAVETWPQWLGSQPRVPHPSCWYEDQQDDWECQLDFPSHTTLLLTLALLPADPGHLQCLGAEGLQVLRSTRILCCLPLEVLGVLPGVGAGPTCSLDIGCPAGAGATGEDSKDSFCPHPGCCPLPPDPSTAVTEFFPTPQPQQPWEPSRIHRLQQVKKLRPQRG